MNIEELEIRKSAINPSDCIGQAWNKLGENYWFYFGVSTVAWLIAIASGMIPVLSIIISPLVTGPLFAGVRAIYLAKADGFQKEFGDMFDGFKKFGPTAIVGLVLSVPGIMLQIYQLVTIVSDISMIMNPDSGGMLERSAFPPMLIGLYLFMIIFGITVGLLLFFSYFLIMEHDLGAVDAIKASARGASGNIGGLIVLMILEGLLLFAGLLACGVGALFVAPVVYLANAIAYRSVFPSKDQVESNPNPPDPGEYGDMFGQMS